MTRALAASLLLMLAAGAVVFLVTGPRIAVSGLTPPETRQQGYSAADVSAYLAALSPEARATYLGPQRLADTLFPIGLATSLALATARALRPAPRLLAALVMLPALAYLAADLTENALTAALLNGADITHLAPRASAATRAKFALVNTALVLLAAAWAARGLASFRRQP